MTKLGVIPPQAIQKFIEQLLETYQFGATSEIMETFQGFEQGQLSDEQIDKVKLGLAEVFKDLSGSEVLPNAQQRVDETKVGVAEVLKDAEGAKAFPDEKQRIEETKVGVAEVAKDLGATPAGAV